MLVSCFEHNTTAGQGCSAVAEAIWRQMQALGVFANLGSGQYATGWMEAVWLNPEPKTATQYGALRRLRHRLVNLCTFGSTTHT